MKKTKDRREIIAKAHNVTTAIKAKLAKKDGEKDKIDLSNMAEKLADRRDKLLSEEGK